MGFWSWFKNLFKVDLPLPVVVEEPVFTKRDTLLAFIYRDILDNPDDWEYVSYSQYHRISNDRKLTDHNNHIINKKADIILRAHFLAHSEYSGYNKDIFLNGDRNLLSYKEFETFANIILNRIKDAKMDKMIARLEARHYIPQIPRIVAIPQGITLEEYKKTPECRERTSLQLEKLRYGY